VLVAGGCVAGGSVGVLPLSHATKENKTTNTNNKLKNFFIKPPKHIISLSFLAIKYNFNIQI